MLVPPVASSGGRHVGDTGTSRGLPTSAGTAALWPLTPAQPIQPPNQQPQSTPPLAATPAPAYNQGVGRYGLYSLFPGDGGGGYVTSTIPGPPTLTTPKAHHTSHKVSESMFSAAVGVGVGGYTWGAPTPPPGSPYSPVPVTQLEFLAKNLTSLATSPGQPTLGLQTVNIGSLHHAQHTQHTQHTLNLTTGLHHLHHGSGIHQNAFSPQLSLVTTNPPALTINSFTPPNSGNDMVPTTGVVLQEYQSPTGSSINCPSSLNSPTCANSPNGNTNSLLVSGGLSTNGNATQLTAKKREAFLPTQGQPIKLENKPRQPCICKTNNGKTKLVHSDAGCSRTLPVVSSWNNQELTVSMNGDGVSPSSNSTDLVKREPLASVPCQVAEVSTSLHATTTAVKIEPMPPKSENSIIVSNGGTGGIPVGIAVARQRLQHQETSSSTRNVSLSHHHTSYHHFQPNNLGSGTAMAMGGTAVVHCSPGGDDRAAHFAFPAGGSLPPSINAALAASFGNISGTATNTANTAAAAAAATATTWPPTIWQYPAAAAAAAAAIPMEPMNFPQMGVGLQSGFQIVRDPTTGHLLLIHAAEQMQQAVVWPNYHNHANANVNAAPPLLLPPPPPSLQLFSDIGTRVVLTESKKKQQPGLPIVKIESDCNNSPTTIITSAETTKALQTVSSITGTLVPDTPMVTTLQYYPHAPTLVQISQTEPTHCKSQLLISKATSPVSCLTPPPETPTINPIGAAHSVQDASNQTDTPDAEEDLIETIVKQEKSLNPCQLQTTTNLTNFEIVASTPEKICNVVRITTTTSVNTAGFVGKVDKAENTIINMADCTKYSLSRNVTSVDHTIEQVITRCEKPETDQVVRKERDERSKAGPRIIEITEENCDSFHENIEFFSRRRLPSEEPEDRLTTTEDVPVEKEDPVEIKVNLEVEDKKGEEDYETQESREANPSGIKAKVFDMPFIGDEHEVDSTQAHASSSTDVNGANKAEPRIESVDKFKRNLTVPSCVNQTTKSPDEGATKPPCPRRLENGLKKLILRSCENSLDKICTTETINRTLESKMKDKVEKTEQDTNKNSNALTNTTETKKGKGKLMVDLSGLELLSNSIEQFEHLKPENEKQSDSSPLEEKSPTKPKSMTQPNEANNNVDSPLRLLCALAEQRFMEEVADDPQQLKQCGKPPTKSQCQQFGDKVKATESIKVTKLIDTADAPSFVSFNNEMTKRNNATVRDDQNEDSDSDAPEDEVPHKEATTAQECDRHQYKSVDSKLEAKKFLARKSRSADHDDDNWPNMNLMELEMRVQLATIQKQYREKQKELSKLTPKKDEKKVSVRPKKRSLSPSSDYENDCEVKFESDDSKLNCRSTQLQSSVPKSNLMKVFEPKSHVRLLEGVSDVETVQQVSSPTVSSVNDDDEKEEDVDVKLKVKKVDSVSSSSASKKRKVGRPRKLLYTSGSTRYFTETIVAKKPKSKHALMKYVMNSKNKQLQNKLSIPILKSSGKVGKLAKTKIKSAKQTQLHNKSVISLILAEKEKLNRGHHSAKIRPKLKAEVKVKTWDDEEWDSSNRDCTEFSPQLCEENIHKEEKNDDSSHETKKSEKPKKKKRKMSGESADRNDAKRNKTGSKHRSKEDRKEIIKNKCKLTSAHLEIDQLRVLTAIGGLFYAGKLSAVQAPDVYSITLDGERGNRPHIHSREEILQDAIVEVCPESTKDLPPGTRLCAYWSQQYRCLYPGTSVEPSEPDPILDEKFVSVEFDDGDSGRISLEDIRYLHPDYPVVEYDTNPLLTLGKRRRLASTDDKRTPNGLQATMNSQESADNPDEYLSASAVEKSSDEEHRERRRSKKHRKDKLKRTIEGKKKHKKHKSGEQHKKHKHRKHRKHKHKRSHHGSHSEASQCSGDSSSPKSEEENAMSCKEDVCENEISEDNKIGQVLAFSRRLPEDELKDLVESETPEVKSETEEIEKERIVIEEEEKDETNHTREQKSRKRKTSVDKKDVVESKSKMAAFLPARQLWTWSGPGYKRPGAKGKSKKKFFKAITRGEEVINVGDSAVFLSTSVPERPYIGTIESMWETTSSSMVVKVKWYYHPEETQGCGKLNYPGALFESPHVDENDVQTISHKCDVLPLQRFKQIMNEQPQRYYTIYENNDLYYLAGHYDPKNYLIKFEPNVV